MTCGSGRGRPCAGPPDVPGCQTEHPVPDTTPTPTQAPTASSRHKHLSVILDESVLRRAVGGAEVMREQLRHLVQAASRPNADLRVLPDAAGAHPSVTGEFTILSFPEGDAPDVVYLENMTSNIYVEREAEVFLYTLVFDRLTSMAMGPEDAVSLITELADHL
ncbi:MAG: DUF5753 domain-containing protein [Streptosporangiaceae bacterium]